MQNNIVTGLLAVLNWPYFQVVMLMTGYLMLALAFILYSKNQRASLALMNQQYQEVNAQSQRYKEMLSELVVSIHRIEEVYLSRQPYSNNHVIEDDNSSPLNASNKIAEQHWTHTNKQRWISWRHLMRLTGGDESLAYDLLAQLVNEIPKVTQVLDHLPTLTYKDRDKVHQWLGLFRMTGVERMSSTVESIQSKLKSKDDQISVDEKECFIADLRDLLVDSLMLIKQKATADYVVKKIA